MRDGKWLSHSLKWPPLRVKSMHTLSGVSCWKWKIKFKWMPASMGIYHHRRGNNGTSFQRLSLERESLWCWTANWDPEGRHKQLDPSLMHQAFSPGLFQVGKWIRKGLRREGKGGFSTLSKDKGAQEDNIEKCSLYPWDQWLPGIHTQGPLDSSMELPWPGIINCSCTVCQNRLQGFPNS